MFDITKIRADFPILNETVNEQPLVYLDSAATSQKPQAVINALSRFYSHENANVHRGRHTLSENATRQYEHTRTLLADYFSVKNNEIVWTKGATESINLIANGLASRLNPGDKIALSAIEHHANIVPWQQLAQRTGAELIIMPIEDDLVIDSAHCSDFIKLHQPKIVAVTHASNTLGNITDLGPILAACKASNAISVVDGAQAAMHLRPNLQEISCDFYVFSAHKMLGPTGLGGLYGRFELLNSLDVYQTGGEMIEAVSLTHSTFREAPGKFEAGTPNIAGVIAFAEAINYLTSLDFQQMRQHEHTVFDYAINKLAAIDGIKIYSNQRDNIGNISFNYRDEHPFDLATLLDGFGVAVRSGHHCTQPIMSHLGIPGTVRASFALYNNKDDVDAFISAVKSSIEILD
ncbi:SufS family cysteine desulfurase [Pseudoalteromonas sp.]|uniref:aminotransferase class V-fold PLP-dependent enzyme n=1 Tax=Pseudoalteromonas sp. TaxID=53249 RepID=UPI000C8A281D|nr:SufS family cysteine desulfurase [Pseudoalteromonas sp.]MAD02508.1 cysteine desulfurase CsdA [Pseudoalteromonas sp.]MCP4956811.1 SufS family cysteine desulfurase [Photobacterium aquimaris]|tara:strand:- start:21065 stop:22279 length:1215 start_codon:yes stop_codon:yes gene_type:complete